MGNELKNETPETTLDKKDNLTAISQTTTATKELKSSKKKPVAFFQEDHDPSAKAKNDALGAAVDHLYEEFQQTVGKAATFKISLNPEISKDCVLSNLVNEYQQTRDEIDELVAYTRQRMAVCRSHPGYLPDLNRLLTKSKNSLTNLQERLVKLNAQINERTQLIAPVEVDETALLNARTELMAALDYFMLNFCLITLHDKTNSNTQFFIEQLSGFTNVLVSGLRNKNFGFSKTSVDALDLRLRTHLGLQTTFERLFSTDDASLITATQADQLVKNLFKNCATPTRAQDFKNELATIFDLVAKIKALPIVKFRNFETLVDCEKKQHEVMLNLNSDLLEFLQQTTRMLQVEISLIASSRYTECSEFKIAQNLLHEYQSKEATLTQIMDDYTKRRTLLKSTPSPLQRLSDITTLQQASLGKLRSLHEQAKQQRIRTQEVALKLEELYTYERSSMSIKLSDAINQAKFALNLSPSGYKEELTKAAETLKLLNQTGHKSGLGSLEPRYTTDLNALKQCVQDVKNSLKLSWAKQLISGLPTKELSNISIYLAPSQITSIIKDALIAYSFPQLNRLNPFIEPLKTQTQRINEQTRILLTHYSNISNKAGSELGAWNNSMIEQLEAIRGLIDQRFDLEEQAELIEKRLNTKAYKTSIKVIKTLNDEFLRILKAHIDLAIANDPNNSALQFLKETPEFYLNQSSMTLEAEMALNQIDSRLIKLFEIRSNFEALNSKYINQDADLCNDEHFIKQLFEITKSHLQNNSMENLSKDVGHKGSSFVFWLRVHVLKPIAQCSEYINPYFGYLYHLGRSNQSNSPRFFRPTCQTPLASRTEYELIRTGKEALNLLESEYQTTLIAAAG